MFGSVFYKQIIFWVLSCSAYEMLVSHSPPVFSHSPPTGFLSDYTPFRLGVDSISRVSRAATCRSYSSSLSFTKLSQSMLASPKRPCLVIRPEESSPLPAASDDDSTSTKLKKRVVFADDKGMCLTHVRVMTEPSNMPPLWSFRFLAEVTQGVTAEPEALAEPWEITFSQPASDYVDFRKRLDTDKVSLENVIVKDAEEVIVGTVKVSNLSYSKEVFIRISSDNWKTFEDAFCNFVPNATATGGATYVLYDTFSFKITIPLRATKIEFCVGYRCEGVEYWDSNDGNNYIISKKNPNMMRHTSFSSNEVYEKTGNQKFVPPPKFGDALQTKLDSWSEFASWTHLENNSPYW